MSDTFKQQFLEYYENWFEELEFEINNCINKVGFDWFRILYYGGDSIKHDENLILCTELYLQLRRASKDLELWNNTLIQFRDLLYLLHKTYYLRNVPQSTVRILSGLFIELGVKRKKKSPKHLSRKQKLKDDYNP